ncbi:3-deoxy-7-phosphoheptulonate synthase [Streptomyces sp. NPDC006711]|uniref:3-deoxy-7-phosphoheptulonate synthase n=1 Tax=Streptomyces sp. NPDC006711 TaxID=3364762 RepID=UPI0036AC1AB7
MNVAINWAGLAESHYALTEDEMRSWRLLPSHQQPVWNDDWLVTGIRRDLALLPELVDADEVNALRLALADVAEGRRQVVQAGDCAEDPAECTPAHLGRKTGLLDALAGVMQMGSGLPVLRVGRFAGQFAKPRSALTEFVDGVELPVYRGHLVNGPMGTERDRRSDPLRMLACHEAATTAMTYLRRQQEITRVPVWASHEALVLDYELPQLRRGGEGDTLLTSTHWPWIGDRTRQIDGAHVRMLALVSNPVACKVGPSMTEHELLRLCALLDPQRSPGRLTLISRMGAGEAARRLPALAAQVREAGHPVVWLCDPMHGNTVRAASGRKTRLLTSVVQEIVEFQGALREIGLFPGGLHLETTPDEVSECVADASELAGRDGRSTTLCDPRLNAEQAISVAANWN